VESGQNQTQVLPVSHHPLKIPQNRRDSHISTAPACTAWKSGKPKIGFPLSHPAHATMMTVLSVNSETKERKSAATRPPHSPCPDFMLIFQLENAIAPHAAPRYSCGMFRSVCLIALCCCATVPAADNLYSYDISR
jgi:hypothetical protein